MEEVTNFLTHTNQLWEAYTYPASSDLDVSDVWQRDDGSHITVTHRKIRHEHAETWLKDQSADPDAGQSRVLQMVWIKHDTKKRVDDISEDLLTRTLDAFGLKSAHGYAKTSFADVTALSGPASATTQTFVLSIHPKLILVWSHDKPTRLTRAVCLGTESYIKASKTLLDACWSFTAHPLFPGFTASAVLAGEIDRDQNEIKREVRETEARTGFHRWSARAERPAPGDLSVLSARMSGCATKLASVQRKTTVVQLLHRMVQDHSQTATATTTTTPATASTLTLGSSPALLTAATAQLQSRLALAAADTAFIHTRTTTQLTALAHLITQHDTLASQSVAQDSRTLALASHRDSASMKTLAVVTILFLPGTFVASLFAMPFFALAADTGRVRVARDFGVYWAVTLPLTAVVVGVWAGWSLWRGWRDRNAEVTERKRLGRELNSLGRRGTGETLGAGGGGGGGDWTVDVDGFALGEIGSLVRKRTALEGKI